MTTEAEMAWAAGFFDGEGCTMLVKTKSGPQLKMIVTQKDPRPLRRFHKIVELGTFHGPYPSQRDMHIWSVQCRRAEEVLMKLWWHLSEPKREQASRAWESYRNRPRKKKSWSEYGRTTHTNGRT